MRRGSGVNTTEAQANRLLRKVIDWRIGAGVVSLYHAWDESDRQIPAAITGSAVKRQEKSVTMMTDSISSSWGRTITYGHDS